MTRVGVEWKSIEPPRQPTAVLAEGASARGLAEGFARRLEDGVGLRSAVGGGALLVLGDADDLPWAPGATYLAHECGVLLPTTMTPTVPVDLLAAAARQLLARTGIQPIQLALLPGRVLVFDVSDTPTDPADLHNHAVEAFR